MTIDQRRSSKVIQADPSKVFVTTKRSFIPFHFATRFQSPTEVIKVRKVSVKEGAISLCQSELCRKSSWKNMGRATVPQIAPVQGCSVKPRNPRSENTPIPALAGRNTSQPPKGSKGKWKRPIQPEQPQDASSKKFCEEGAPLRRGMDGQCSPPSCEAAPTIRSSSFNVTDQENPEVSSHDGGWNDWKALALFGFTDGTGPMTSDDVSRPPSPETSIVEDISHFLSAFERRKDDIRSGACQTLASGELHFIGGNEEDWRTLMGAATLRFEEGSQDCQSSLSVRSDGLDHPSVATDVGTK